MKILCVPILLGSLVVGSNPTSLAGADEIQASPACAPCAWAWDYGSDPAKLCDARCSGPTAQDLWHAVDACMCEGPCSGPCGGAACASGFDVTLADMKCIACGHAVAGCNAVVNLCAMDMETP